MSPRRLSRKGRRSCASTARCTRLGVSSGGSPTKGSSFKTSRTGRSSDPTERFRLHVREIAANAAFQAVVVRSNERESGLMWHLRRVHMESIGHPDARFDPLTMDFTDTTGTPTSSVLWLENMGGKTSWLSLVFSTLCPALKDFLGKPDKRLGDYILSSDTAHVILEFSQVIGVRALIGGDTRLLLGQVLQWRDHRQDRVRESTSLQRRLWGVVGSVNRAFTDLRRFAPPDPCGWNKAQTPI